MLDDEDDPYTDQAINPRKSIQPNPSTKSAANNIGLVSFTVGNVNDWNLEKPKTASQNKINDYPSTKDYALKSDFGIIDDDFKSNGLVGVNILDSNSDRTALPNVAYNSVSSKNIIGGR